MNRRTQQEKEAKFNLCSFCSRRPEKRKFFICSKAKIGLCNNPLYVNLKAISYMYIYIHRCSHLSQYQSYRVFSTSHDKINVSALCKQVKPNKFGSVLVSAGFTTECLKKMLHLQDGLYLS